MEEDQREEVTWTEECSFGFKLKKMSQYVYAAESLR